MKALRTLNKSQRLQLKDDLDYILSYLRKDTAIDFHRQLRKLEQKLRKQLIDIWDSQGAKAVDMTSKYMDENQEELNESFAKAIASSLNMYMGSEFVKIVKDKGLVGHIHNAYDMVGNRTAKLLELPYALTFTDVRAKAWLKKDIIYWIGQFYNDHIKEAVTQTVIQYAIEEGQDAWTTGQRIKEVLNGTYEIPPKYLPGSYIQAESYWQGLATNAITRASVFGGIEPMAQAEVVEYEIINPMDGRTSPICRHMNGKRFSLTHAVELRDKVISADNPEDIKTLHPWPKLEEVKDLDVKQLAARGYALPPYHFHCRTDIVAVSFKEYS